MKVQKHRVLAVVATLVGFAAPALAQFEISPSHFDDAQAAVSAKVSPRQQEIEKKIAEQQTILSACHAQIKAKSDEIADAIAEVGDNGNEAGEAEALWIHERELQQLRANLEPQITVAETTLAGLQRELDTLLAKSQPGTPLVLAAKVKKHSRPGPSTSLRATLRAAR